MVTTTINRSVQAGNNITTAFNFAFKFIDDGDILVYLQLTGGSDVLQTITTHYTLTGSGTDAGIVTFVTPPPSGSTVTIQRSTALTQLLDYIKQDNFPAESHESALDRLTLAMQEAKDASGSSVVSSNIYLKFPVSEPVSQNGLLPSVAERSDKTFVWLPDGSVGYATPDTAPLLDDDTMGGATPSVLFGGTQSAIKIYIDAENVIDQAYTDSEIVIAKAYTDTVDTANSVTDQGYTDTVDTANSVTDQAYADALIAPGTFPMVTLTKNTSHVTTSTNVDLIINYTNTLHDTGSYTTSTTGGTIKIPATGRYEVSFYGRVSASVRSQAHLWVNPDAGSDAEYLIDTSITPYAHMYDHDAGNNSNIAFKILDDFTLDDVLSVRAGTTDTVASTLVHMVFTVRRVLS